MLPLHQTTIRIYTSGKRGSSWEFPLKPFITGIKQVKSVLLDFQPAHASTIKRMYITFLASILLLRRNKKSFTVEYLPKNKKMASIDKLDFSDNNTLVMYWLQTLARELIGKEKDFKPFWNSQCLENSKRLWLPTEIGSVASHLNSSNLSSLKQKPKSSFSIQMMENQLNRNSQMMYYPSFTSTPVGNSEKEDTGIRTRRIRIYPTKKQQKTLKEWMGTYRYVYNEACSYVKNLPKQSVDVYGLTERFINEFEPDSVMVDCHGLDDKGNPCGARHRASMLGCPNHRPKNLPKKKLNPNPNIPEWTMDTPKDIRKEALFELRTAYKSAYSNLRNGNISGFNFGFKSKKKNYPITLPKTAIRFNDKNNLIVYPSYKLDEIRLSKRQKKKDLIDIKKECKIQCKDNKWYFLIPFEPQLKIVVPEEKTFCSLDPGARTFQTLYSPEGVIKFQHNRELLKRLRKKLDYLQSLRAKKWIRSNHYKRIRQKIYCHIGWIVDQIHYSTINELKHYQHILLPIFESQEIVKQKCLSRDSKRELMSLQHYTFKQRLKNSLYFQKDTKLYIVSEAYTSKTCTRCGVLNDVGSNEIYHCEECDLVIDRDINGARNILLKNLCSI